MNFIRNLLYQLKKEYGKPVDLYVQTLTATDLKLGTKTLSRIRYRLKKVPVLPFKYLEQALYSPAFLKAAHKFNYGEYQNYEVKDFLIDGSDLPRNFEIKPDHYIVLEHKKYEIANIVKVETAYICTGKRLPGETVDELHQTSNIQTIRFTHNVIVVKN